MYKTVKTKKEIALTEHALDITEGKPTQTQIDAWVADVVGPMTYLQGYDFKVKQQDNLLIIIAYKDAVSIEPVEQTKDASEETSKEEETPKAYWIGESEKEDGEYMVHPCPFKTLSFAKLAANLASQSDDHYYQIVYGTPEYIERELEICYHQGKNVWE